MKLLDLSYSDSCLNTIASLDEKFPELNNKTTIKLAHIARNKFFIAHKSCQKWLVQRWHGNLLIREVDYGVFKLPNWLKVWMFKAPLKATLKMQFKNIHLQIQWICIFIYIWLILMYWTSNNGLLFKLPDLLECLVHFPYVILDYVWGERRKWDQINR